jgi:hypothetical protein
VAAAKATALCALIETRVTEYNATQAKRGARGIDVRVGGPRDAKPMDAFNANVTKEEAKDDDADGDANDDDDDDDGNVQNDTAMAE